MMAVRRIQSRGCWPIAIASVDFGGIADMTRSNNDKKEVGCSQPHFDGWCWLQSRLDHLVNDQSAQELSDWMSGELTTLERVYADQITKTSEKHAASLLIDERRA
jgi:hypothetical protein